MNNIEISESLHQFIEALVEEVALNGKSFDTKKKWLRMCCEAEGLDHEAFESNLNDLFEALDDWKRQKSKTSQLAARMLAKKLCLSENMVEKLVDERTPQPLPEPILATEFVDPQLLMRNGKLEEIEKDGHLLTPCVWKWADCFHEGLARVKAEDGLGGYIDTMGNVVIPCKWKIAENFSEGLALVQNKNSAFFFIDKSGNIVISCGSDINPYLQCGGFYEGLAVVQDTKSRRYGFIDKSGHIAIPCQWEDASYFSEGMATVWHNEKCGCIDKTGRLVIPCRFNEGLDFHEGLAFVFSDDEDGEYVIDKTGHKVFDMVLQHYDSCFQEGLASSDDNGFVDQNGELVIEDKWSPCGMGFAEGMAPTEDGYIDHSGRVVIPNDEWENYGEFREGLALVVKNRKHGYIDHTGRLVIPYVWDSACSFSEGLAKVELADKYYFINKQGQVLCKVKRPLQ